MTIFRLAVVVSATLLATWAVRAQPAPPTEMKEPPLVATIAADEGPLYNDALDNLTIKSREEVINALVARLNKAPLTGETKSMGIARIVIALGRLRAEEAAKPLAARLGLTFAPTSGFMSSVSGSPPPFTPQVDALCQHALIAIGKASLAPVFHDYEKTRKDALGHANVIVGVLDDDPDLAKAWLAKWPSSKKAADELIAAIDARLAEQKKGEK